MENDYTRACKDLADTLHKSTNMVGVIPAVQMAFNHMAIQMEILSIEEKKRLFWEMVEGGGPKSTIRSLIDNKPKYHYRTTFFNSDGLGNTPYPEETYLTGWMMYLKSNLDYIKGELADEVSPHKLHSYNTGITLFNYGVVGSYGLYNHICKMETILPRMSIDRVYYTNFLEDVREVDITVLLNTVPKTFMSKDFVISTLNQYMDLVPKAVVVGLAQDNPGIPSWVEYTTVGRFLSNDELIISIDNFTTDTSNGNPIPFELSFYRDEEDNLCYKTNNVAKSFLSSDIGLWQSLPFAIRYLIGKFDITSQGKYQANYDIVDDDLVLVDVVKTFQPPK